MAKKRRSAKRSSGSGGGAFLAVLALVGLGAAGWWTASGKQHPDFSRLISRFSTPKNASETKPRPKEAVAAVKPSQKPEENKAKVNVPVRQKDEAPRPPLPVRAVVPASREPASTVTVLRPPAPINPVETKTAMAGIPVGRPTPETTPSVIFARDRLVIREHAWDKSAAVGTVERGREMRSYSRTGKWHRVTVPTTGIVGWVHEDMLSSRPSPFMTGSISR
jgi:hypothetical protein